MFPSAKIIIINHPSFAKQIIQARKVGCQFYLDKMIDELETSIENSKSWDISSLRLVMSSGVMFSAPLKERLLNMHNCTILDALGSSEGTGMGKQVTSRKRKDTGTARFYLGEHTRVITEDGQELEPGSKQIGKLALGYPLPVGYYKDPEKTEKTFATIAIPFVMTL